VPAGLTLKLPITFPLLVHLRRDIACRACGDAPARRGSGRDGGAGRGGSCGGLGGAVAAAHRRGGGGCHGAQASGGLRPHEEEGEELPPAQATPAGEVKTWITAQGDGMYLYWRFEIVAGCRGE
jgi:hypothetical protein